MSREDRTTAPDWNEPATEEDLHWWMQLAPTLRWTWAKTFAEFAPHWWATPGKTPGFAQADAWRVGRVIRTFGEPGKFWKRTNLYLFTPDRARKFWMMWEVPLKPEVVTLVNLAMSDQVYGKQEHFDEEWLRQVRLPRPEGSNDRG